MTRTFCMCVHKSSSIQKDSGSLRTPLEHAGERLNLPGVTLLVIATVPSLSHVSNTQKGKICENGCRKSVLLVVYAFLYGHALNHILKYCSAGKEKRLLLSYTSHIRAYCRDNDSMASAPGRPRLGRRTRRGLAPRFPDAASSGLTTVLFCFFIFSLFSSEVFMCVI